MTASLLIADCPLYEPMSVAILSHTRTPPACESVPFDEVRWDAWRAKGRCADAASTERIRSLAALVVSIVCTAGVFWIGFD